MNNSFGSEQWSFQHYINGRPITVAQAHRIFEEGYERYFDKNSDVLEALVKNYSDVYDTAPSNVDSKLDYSIQECPKYGYHIHDIAIRAAVTNLKKSFQGKKLLQVRGKDSAGYYLSPGNIPFLVPGITYTPYKRGWWQPGTIEDFYQGTRHIRVVPASVRFIFQSAHTENQIKFGCERVAARFVHSLAPYLEGRKISATRLSTIPWRLDATSLPVDLLGRYRAFSNDEIIHTMKGALGILEFIGKQDAKIQKDSTMSSAMNAARRLVECVESTLLYGRLPDVPPAAKKGQEMELIGQEILEALTWAKHAHHFYKPLEGNRAIPLFLIRDGLAPAEYINYQALVTGKKGTYLTLYIPGAPQGIGKNKRGTDPLLKALVHAGEAIARTVHEEGGESKELNDTFSRSFKDWLCSDVVIPNDPLSEDQIQKDKIRNYCYGIYEKVIASINVYDYDKSLTIMDTHGSGKTALMVKAILEFYAEKDSESKKWSTIEIVLGQQVSKIFGQNFPQTFSITTLQGSCDTNDLAMFPDIRWPFSFDSTGIEEPIFDFHGNPSSMLKLLFRSVLFYNAAVKTGAERDSTTVA
jgi:hypothetical protein